MLAPQPFFSQALVLLADYNSFCASYVASVLSAAGARVAGPFLSEEELEKWLATAVEMPDVALVALDTLRETHEAVLSQLRPLGVPYLLVQNSPWLGGSEATEASFSWPYGGFQIADALCKAMHTATQLHSPAADRAPGGTPATVDELPDAMDTTPD